MRIPIETIGISFPNTKRNSVVGFERIMYKLTAAQEMYKKNAEKIMKANSLSACNSCGSCLDQYTGPQNPQIQSNTPFVFASALSSASES